MDLTNSRIFLDKIQQRRTEVFEHSKKLKDCEQIASFIFEFLTRLAQNNQSHLDRSMIQKFNDQRGKFDRPLSEVQITTMEGMILSLEQALTLGAPPPSTHEIINALFAQGYREILEERPAAERRTFTSRVIKLLPMVEKLGPFLLSDYIDYACSEEDAVRFWQLYVEKVASQLGRKTQDQDRENHTWILSGLLAMIEDGPSALVGRKWELLRKHIDRIVQSQQNEWRWRLLRVLVEACQDEKVLYFVLTSPAVMEDKEIPFIFLTRGNSKLQSCALFLIAYSRVSRKMINRILEYFEHKTLAEVADRLVEIYAQTQLWEHPPHSIEIIAAGISSIVAHHLQSEPIEVLINSVNNDARAFRQNLLLTYVVPKDRHNTTPAQSQLLERVLQSFFHSFTPSGIRHPLNDRIYHKGVIQAVVELVRIPGSNHVATLKSFGLNLYKAAERWLPDTEDANKRRLLLTYFIGIYAYVLRIAARELYSNLELQPKAIELYKILVELYILEPLASADAGAYGSLTPILNALYPEFISPERVDDVDMARIDEVALLMGQIEEEQIQVDRLAGLLEQWTERNWGRELVNIDDEENQGGDDSLGLKDLEVAQSGFIPILTQKSISTPVVLLNRFQDSTQSILRSYLGLELFKHVSHKILYFVGIRRYGDLLLSADQVCVREKHSLAQNQNVLGMKEIRFHVSQISGLSIQQPLRSFYYVLGFLSLITFSLIGAHFLFAGVRGAELNLVFLGVMLVTVGFAFDEVMVWLARLGSKQVFLQIFRLNQTKPIAVAIDKSTADGQALLNTFMSQEAMRREERFNSDWSAMTAQKSINQHKEQEQAQKQDHDDVKNEDKNQSSSTATSNKAPPLDPAEKSDPVSSFNMSTAQSAELDNEKSAANQDGSLVDELAELSVTQVNQMTEEDNGMDPNTLPPQLPPQSSKPDVAISDTEIARLLDQQDARPPSAIDSAEDEPEFVTTLGQIDVE